MICNNSKILNIRPIERDDLKLIQKWRNFKSIQPLVREYREMSMDHIIEWYDNTILNNKFEFFIIEDKKNKPIAITGFTYIDWVNKNADLHLAIYEYEWGDLKIGSEIMQIMLAYGFKFLNLHRIYAEIYEIDIKKLKLFESFNFKTDAVLRDHFYHDGSYKNSHILSLLKSEYGR
ncbi:MAG: GNAT family N-acetyltransferase [Flavobacteriaceae bacterium]